MRAVLWFCSFGEGGLLFLVGHSNLLWSLAVHHASSGTPLPDPEATSAPQSEHVSMCAGEGGGQNGGDAMAGGERGRGGDRGREGEVTGERRGHWLCWEGRGRGAGAYPGAGAGIMGALCYCDLGAECYCGGRGRHYGC